MNEKVYMHAIQNLNFNKQLFTFLKIIKDGELLSLRNQGINYSDSFSGLDYISLCDYEKRDLFPEDYLYYNAYNLYIKNYISLAFEKDKVDAIIPYYFELNESPKKNDKIMKILGNDPERYSDFLDEVQVKDRLSLDSLAYVTFPMQSFLFNSLTITRDLKFSLVKQMLDNIRDTLDSNNYNVDIYDIEEKTIIDEKSLKRIFNKYY